MSPACLAASPQHQQRYHLGKPTHTCDFWECATEKQAKAETEAEVEDRREKAGSSNCRAGKERLHKVRLRLIWCKTDLLLKKK